MTTRKVFVPLENNPDVMTKLAHKLGLSEELEFQDAYSLTDPDLLAIVPRPAHALLFIYPDTLAAQKFHDEENERSLDYNGSGTDEPVMFYRQVITHACGLIGLLHCVTNGYAATRIQPDSDLANLIQRALPLKPQERAEMLHDSEVLEAAHDIAAHTGDSVAPPRGECPDQAFIAFVKGNNGHLYELEGSRKGPIDLGLLPPDADVLSQEALQKGPLAFIEREAKRESGNMMFSCTVLVSDAF